MDALETRQWVRFDPDDESTWPLSGQVVAVQRRFSGGWPQAWECLQEEPHYDDVERGDLWTVVED